MEYREGEYRAKGRNDKDTAKMGATGIHIAVSHEGRSYCGG